MVIPIDVTVNLKGVYIKDDKSVGTYHHSFPIISTLASSGLVQERGYTPFGIKKREMASSCAAV